MKIRCCHKEGDVVCNNILGVKKGNVIIITRRGRTIRAELSDRAIQIKCEKCGGITRIYADKA